jgi:hydroxymethylpyrimidine/phosphomethylpyrimidine kinase
VANRLSTSGIPLIVDPVMVAGVGDSLMRKLLKALKERVLLLRRRSSP